MKLFWLPSANAMELILVGSEQLLEMPEHGRPMDDETGRCELYLPFGAAAYVLRSKLYGEVVAIISVWHSREQR